MRVPTIFAERGDRRRDRGSSMIEYALMIPLVITMLGTLTDCTLFMISQRSMSAAAAEALRYATSLETMEEGSFDNLTAGDPNVFQRKVHEKAEMLSSSLESSRSIRIVSGSLQIHTEYTTAPSRKNYIVRLAVTYQGLAGFPIFDGKVVTVESTGNFFTQ